MPVPPELLIPVSLIAIVVGAVLAVLGVGAKLRIMTAPPAERAGRVVAVALGVALIATGVYLAPIQRTGAVPPAGDSRTGATAGPSAAAAPSVSVVTPHAGEVVMAACASETSCTVYARGAFDGGGGSLHPYALIASAESPGVTPVYYIQWDSTKIMSPGEWSVAAYVASPVAGRSFLLKAVLTREAVQPPTGGNGVLKWSPALSRDLGLVAESETVAFSVSGEKTCVCPS